LPANGSTEPYVVGPTQYATPPQPNAYLLRAQTAWHVTVGLAWSF
jgi:hypothetical protein